MERTAAYTRDRIRYNYTIQRRTVLECTVAYTRDRVRDDYTIQRRAAIERVCAYTRDRIRYNYTIQRRTVLECTVAYTRDRIRNYDTIQRRTVLECTVAYTRDMFSKFNFYKTIALIAVPTEHTSAQSALPDPKTACSCEFQVNTNIATNRKSKRYRIVYITACSACCAAEFYTVNLNR